MIVLDTNVLSELMRVTPEQRVLQWLDAQDPRKIYSTSITQAELLYGVNRLPTGARKTRLSEQLNILFSEVLQGKVLSFDSLAANAYAALTLSAEQSGRTMPQNDAMIAAICTTQNAKLITRNTRDFETTKLAVVNPWA